MAELQKEIDGICKPRSDPLDISKDMRLMAAKELHETPEILRRNIEKLRKLIQGRYKNGIHKVHYKFVTYMSLKSSYGLVLLSFGIKHHSHIKQS